MLCRETGQSATRRPERSRGQADTSAPGEHGRLQPRAGALSLGGERAIVHDAPAGGWCPGTYAETAETAADVPEHHQRPLQSDVEGGERREGPDHAASDVRAATEARHVEADRAGGREDDAPADRNQADADEREQPAPCEIADHRQRGERDQERPGDEQHGQHHQQQHLQREQADGEDEGDEPEQRQERAARTEGDRAAEHHEHRAVEPPRNDDHDSIVCVKTLTNATAFETAKR